MCGTSGFVSNHGTIWTLHLEELNDERRAPSNNLRWKVTEWTVLDTHDGKLAAKSQFKGKAVQVGVVVQIQFF